MDALNESFGATVAQQRAKLNHLGVLEDKCTLAIDMHLIRRWDKEHGAELVRSKARGKTGTFERYMTAQVTDHGSNLTLAALPMPALEDKDDYVQRMVESSRNTGANIDLVLLDREFFTTDVIRN